MFFDDVYVDMDGVLVDFDAGFSALIGEVRDSQGGWYTITAEQLRMIEEAPRFWLDLPETCRAHQIWTMAQILGTRVHVLSSCRMANGAVQKPLWMKQHFDHDDTIVVNNNSEKTAYAHSKALLVDDHRPNIDEWRRAGGYALWLPVGFCKGFINEMNNVEEGEKAA